MTVEDARPLRIKRTLLSGLLALLLTSGVVASSPVRAEQRQVRISYQFGLGFFPITVVMAKKLIEKHANELGLGEVTVSGVQLSGASITNDALLSGSLDVASGGVGGLLQIWDKSNGKVKGLVSVNDMSFLLNTNDPAVRKLDDYLRVEGHKIALPAVNVGAHAIVLAIASQQRFGKTDVLDHLTVSLPHPEAYAALVGGHSEVRSHFASLPYSIMELKHSSIHTVLSSYDVMGGPHNNTLLYTTEVWQHANPVLAKAVFDAFVEAENWINSNPRSAAELFVSFNKSSLGVDEIEEIIRDPKLTTYAPEPRGTMKVATFLKEAGRIRRRPSSWKDFFWDIAHTLHGT